jgi:Flp pilus assembly protein TadG
MARNLRHDCGGATAVEFAVLLPVLLLVLTGILEFGRALWIRQDMQFAVEEAARYALVNDTASASAITGVATARLGAVGPATPGVTVATTIASDSVTVAATAVFTPIFTGLLPEGMFTMTARARTPR